MSSSRTARPTDESSRIRPFRYSLSHRRHEWAALAVIVGLALAIQLFNLGGFPDTVNPDECSNTQDVLHLLHGRPPQHGFFGFD